MTGLGLGLIGTFLHTALNEKPDPLAPYHYAQGLIRAADRPLRRPRQRPRPGRARRRDPQRGPRRPARPRRWSISVPRGDTLTPLVTKAMGASVNVSECEDIARRGVGGRHCPCSHDHVFAFPLNTEAGTTAIVAGVLSARVDPARLGVEDRIRKLTRRLGPSAVHLDTALLFSAFRDAATAEERRRLAREMHDGVAQDIASLGYLVDDARGRGRLARAGRAARHAARADHRRRRRRSDAPSSRCAPASARARASAPPSARSPAT